MPTVSRSVDRVFQVMELFGMLRRPLSATEVREALNMPHSSAVSLLARLVDLDYLEQNAETKRYFPSLRLTHLCEAVPHCIARGSVPAQLVDAVHGRSGETTSLSRISGLFTLPVYVRTASYQGAHRVTPGATGGLATQSVSGQALISLMPDDELRYFIRRSEFWARRARVAIAQNAEQVMRSVQRAREVGYLCAFDQLLQGVGVVSYPLPRAPGEDALAITVAGPTEHIRPNIDAILDLFREELGRAYGSRAAPAAKAAP